MAKEVYGIGSDGKMYLIPNNQQVAHYVPESDVFVVSNKPQTVDEVQRNLEELERVVVVKADKSELTSSINALSSMVAQSTKAHDENLIIIADALDDRVHILEAGKVITDTKILEVSNKLDSFSLENVDDKFVAIEAKVDSNTTTIETKVDVIQYASDMNDIHTDLRNKADHGSLYTLTTNTNIKLADFNNKLDDNILSVEILKEDSATKDELSTGLDTKVDKVVFETYKSEQEDKLELKSDKIEVDSKFDTKIDKTELETTKLELENIILELDNKVETFDDRISLNFSSKANADDVSRDITEVQDLSISATAALGEIVRVSDNEIRQMIFELQSKDTSLETITTTNSGLIGVNSAAIEILKTVDVDIYSKINKINEKLVDFYTQDQINEKLEAINGTISTINSTIETIKSDIAALPADVIRQVQLDIINPLLLRVEALETDMLTVKTNIAECIKKDEFDAEIATINTSIDAANTRIADIYNELNTKINTLSVELRLELSNVKSSVSLLNTKLDDIRSEFDAALLVIQNNSQNITNLKASVLGINSKLSEHTTNIIVNSTNINNNSTDILSIKQDLNTFLNTFNDAIDAIEVKIDDTVVKVDAVVVKVDANTINISTLDTKIDANTINISTLDTKINSTKVELDTKITDNSVSMSELEDKVDANKTELDTKISDNTVSMSELEDKVDATKTELDTKISDNTVSISALDTKIDSTKTELDTKISDNTVSISALDTKIDSTKTELDTKIDANTINISTLDTKIDSTKTELDTKIDANTINISTLDTKKANLSTLNAGMDTLLIAIDAKSPHNFVTQQLALKANRTEFDLYSRIDHTHSNYASDSDLIKKLDKPFINGTNGQILSYNNGSTSWITPADKVVAGPVKKAMLLISGSNDLLSGLKVLDFPEIDMITIKFICYKNSDASAKLYGTLTYPGFGPIIKDITNNIGPIDDLIIFNNPIVDTNSGFLQIAINPVDISNTWYISYEVEIMERDNIKFPYS